MANTFAGGLLEAELALAGFGAGAGGPYDGASQPSTTMVSEAPFWAQLGERWRLSDGRRGGLSPTSSEPSFSVSLQLPSDCREALECAPDAQPPLDCAPPAFLATARAAFGQWWTDACRTIEGDVPVGRPGWYVAANEPRFLSDVEHVLTFYASVAAPYSRVRTAPNDPVTPPLDGAAPSACYGWLSEMAWEHPNLLHLFLMLHTAHRSTSGSGRLGGGQPFNSGNDATRQTFLDGIANAAAQLPTIAELIKLAAGGVAAPQQAERDGGTDQTAGASQPLALDQMCCCSELRRPLQWRIVMARCGILAASLMHAHAMESLTRGPSASWYRAAVCSDRCLADAMRTSAALPEDDPLKRELLLLVADTMHFIALCAEQRWSALTSAINTRHQSPGHSPLHMVLQAVGDDPRFLRQQHATTRSFFPYAQVLSALTTVVLAEGRLRLSLCSAILDLQRALPAIGGGILLRILQHLMGNAAGGNHGHYGNRLMEERRGHVAAQQHIMEEGFVGVCATVLLHYLHDTRSTLEAPDATATVQAILASPSGARHGYPRLPAHLADRVHAGEAVVVAVLDMCRSVVVVSQHHSTNPVTFLIAPMGEHHLALGTCLLDHVRDFGALSSAVTTATLSFVAACIHHNVRDVVPALLERGALDLVLSLIAAPNASATRPMVRLATAQVLQAFSVHQQSRDAIAARAADLPSIFDGLVECMDYPMSRIAMSPEGAAARDWPQKIPSELIATCAKEFFALLKDMPSSQAHRSYEALATLLKRVAAQVPVAPTWKLREALEQVVEFLSAIPAGGARDARDASPFGFQRRREDAGSATVGLGPEMKALHDAGVGQHVQDIVSGMLRLIEGGVEPCGSENSDLVDSPVQRIARSETPDEVSGHLATTATGSSAPTSPAAVAQPSSAGHTAAAIMSLDVLAPVVYRLEPQDFALAVSPITRAVARIAAQSRLDNEVSEQQAFLLQSALQFVTQMPEHRRTPEHVASAKERLLNHLNDVYCVCMQRFQRPPQPSMSAAHHLHASVPASLSQLPPPPRAIGQFMSAMHKMFTAGASPGAMHGGGGMRGRGFPSPNALDSPTTTSVERALEVVDVYLRGRERCTEATQMAPTSRTPDDESAAAALPRQQQAPSEMEADVKQTLLSVIVQLQAAISMLSPSTNRAMPPPLPVGVRLSELVRLSKSLGIVLHHVPRSWTYPEEMEPTERHSDPLASNEEDFNDPSAGSLLGSAAKEKGAPMPMVVPHGSVLALFIDAVDLLIAIAKLAVCGNRLASRDSERRRDVCQLVYRYFQTFAPRRVLSKKILAGVMQLLAAVSRGSLFTSPPPTRPAHGPFGEGAAARQSPRAFGLQHGPPEPLSPVHLRRSRASEAMRYRPTDAEPARRFPGFLEGFPAEGFDALDMFVEDSLNLHTSSMGGTLEGDSIADALRGRILDWVAEAMGPMSSMCPVESTQQNAYEIMPGQAGVTGSPLDIDLRRAASQVVFAAFGSPHFRDAVVSMIGTRLQADFSRYAPLLQVFATCIAQKGNILLRRAIACASPLPGILIAQLDACMASFQGIKDAMATAPPIALQRTAEAPDDEATAPEGNTKEAGQQPAAAASSIRLRRTLSEMETIVSFFYALQFPPSPNIRNHHIVERVCDHYQNGFCWHGADCPHAHSDSLMHLRTTLESSDRRALDILRTTLSLPCCGDAANAVRSPLPNQFTLDPPAFLSGQGATLLSGPEATALMSKLAACMTVLAAEQRGATPPASYTQVPLQFPLYDHACAVFRAAVRLAAQLLHRDEDRSKRVLYNVPLEVYGAFDQNLSPSHRHFVAQLVRYSIEDSAASDALVYRSLIKVADEHMDEDPRRESLVQALAPEHRPVLEERVQAPPQAPAAFPLDLGLHGVDGVTQGGGVMDTPGGLRPAPPPPATAHTEEHRVYSCLFTLSELLADLGPIGAKFPVAASRAIANHCIPAALGDNEQRLHQRRQPTRGTVWIAPKTAAAPDGHQCAFARQYRSASKHVLRRLFELLDTRVVSSDFVVAVLAECASLPQIQLAAFARIKQQPSLPLATAALPHAPPAAVMHESVFVYAMKRLSAPNPKLSQFLWCVAMRNPKLAVAEWMRALECALQRMGAADAAKSSDSPSDADGNRKDCDSILMGIEGLMRHSVPSRDRLVVEMSRPHVVEALCRLFVDHEGFMPNPSAAAALLFICSLLKIVPAEEEAPPRPTPSGETAADSNRASGMPCHPTNSSVDAAAMTHDPGNTSMMMLSNVDEAHYDHLDAPHMHDAHHQEEEEHDDLGDGGTEDDEEIVFHQGSNTGQPGAADPIAPAGQQEDDDDDEVDDDDDDEDDDDEDDDDDQGQFAEFAGIVNPMDDDMDDDNGGSDEFRIIGQHGEQIELRYAGGRHSLIVRGEAGLDHDPDLIRELLYRAHMSEMHTGSDRHGLHRFLRRNDPSSRSGPPTPGINPDEVSAMFWQQAVGANRVVALPSAPPPPPPAAPSSAERGASPTVAPQNAHDTDRPAPAEWTPDDLIMQLFGNTRTPSNNRIENASQAMHDANSSAGTSGMREGHSDLVEGLMMEAGAQQRPAAALPASHDEAMAADVEPLMGMFPLPADTARPEVGADAARTDGATDVAAVATAAAPQADSSDSSSSSSHAQDDTVGSVGGLENVSPIHSNVPPPPTVVVDDAVDARPTEVASSQTDVVAGAADADVAVAQPSNDAEPEQVTPAAGGGEEALPWEGALDPRFLAELPPDVRADILREHFPILVVPELHAAPTGQQTHFHPLFLAALPSDMQQEILALEATIAAPTAAAAVPTTASAPPAAAPSTAGPDQAAPAPVPDAPMSEALMLLMVITEQEIRRDILMSCDLSELESDPAIHAEAVRLREEQRVVRAQREAQQAARQRDAMALQEAQARQLELQAARAPPLMHHLRRRADEEEAPLMRPRDRAKRRTARDAPPPPQTAAQLKSCPMSTRSAISLCRFVASSATSSLLAKILTNVLEGASGVEVSHAVHALLDIATAPLTEAMAQHLTRTHAARSEEGRTGGGQNRPDRPLKAWEQFHQGDAPPPAFVYRILQILGTLLQRSRPVLMAMVTLPSSAMVAPATCASDETPAPSVAPSSIEDVFRTPTAEDQVYLAELPLLQLLGIMAERPGAPEVQDAIERILKHISTAVVDLESEASIPRERLDASIRAPPQADFDAGRAMRHPRHPHPLQWTDCLADHRYHGRPFQCNVCRVTHHYWGFRCTHCQFDACPGCALDAVGTNVQKDRLSRWGYWAIASTTLLQDAAAFLSSAECREDAAVRIVRMMSRGIRLCAHEDAPSDAPLCELEEILGQQARRLMQVIREALRRTDEAQDTAQRLAKAPPEGWVAPRKEATISKLLALLELPEDVMRHVYLLFLPFAETRRALRPEMRNMFHASRLYLTEISNLLSQHPNRLRAALPVSAFPLLNGYAQFYLLYGSGDTESMSMAERSETERLMSEKQTDASPVSDTAVAAAATRRPRRQHDDPRGPLRPPQLVAAETEREKLPHHVFKFCESNRTLINTLIHWDPSLLDEGFKFIARAPRLVDLDFKLKSFRRSFARNRQRSPQVSIAVNRLTCFQDSFKALKDLEDPAPVHIRFQGEEGSDAGGVGREWFQILGEEMVNDNYALFVHSSEGMTYQPNPCSAVNANHLDYFRFCGTVVGLAVFNDVSLDIHFTRSVYRHMIGVEPCFRDIESIDPEIYSNLEKLLSMDITPEMNLDFTVTFERFGKTEEAELLPNGANILVTNENKKEYIRLRSSFLMTQQIEAQLRAFLTGFYRMVPRAEVQCFTEQELELVISGMPDIDVEDLRLNTEYSGYTASSPIIRWFWEIVSSMTRQDRANLLQFTTGSSKVPLGGFANLETGGLRHRFSITKTDVPIELLPQAHTCFNRIDLPDYPTADMLREKLLLAITYGNKGFTMV